MNQNIFLNRSTPSLPAWSLRKTDLPVSASSPVLLLLCSLHPAWGIEIIKDAIRRTRADRHQKALSFRFCSLRPNVWPKPGLARRRAWSAVLTQWPHRSETCANFLGSFTSCLAIAITRRTNLNLVELFFEMHVAKFFYLWSDQNTQTAGVHVATL